MADYIEALRQGFEAARKADLARKEIREVLAKFKEDVLKGSEGKVLIEVAEFEEELNFSEIARTPVFGVPRRTYRALCAINPNLPKPSYKKLATWRESNEGYPCYLTLGKQELQLEDRAALERGLAELLKDPIVGQTLYSLTKQK